MGFTLKFREVDSRGSFVAAGVGFRYHYNPDALVLDILNARSERPLLYIDFEERLSKNPLLYISLLEKTLQTQALVFSNNMSVDLSDSFDEARLAAILEFSALLARHAYDLQREDFKRFDEEFSALHFLKRVQIKKVDGLDPAATFFIGKLTTLNQNAVNGRACSVHHLARVLGDKVVRELITTELCYPFQPPAHDLLHVSSRLSTISRVLDPLFSPADHLHAARQKAVAARTGESTVFAS